MFGKEIFKFGDAALKIHSILWVKGGMIEESRDLMSRTKRMKAQEIWTVYES